MRLRVRFRPHVTHAQLHQIRGRQDRGLHVRADGDNGPLDLVDTELREHGGIGSICLHGLRELGRHLAHQLVRSVNAEHLHAMVHELAGQRVAEAAEAHDRDGRDVDGLPGTKNINQ